MAIERSVSVPAGAVTLAGDLAVPAGAAGLVVFAHGSGSSRLSPRNRQVATALQERGLGTLLFDLLTPEEERIDRQTAALRFNIELLSARLVGAVDWVSSEPATADLPVGLFGASTGAAAALVAAADRPALVSAVVSRGGRPDLAGPALPLVRAPTLLIVGGEDHVVLELNRRAQQQMRAETELVVIPGATHLFEEPGALEAVSELAADWFSKHARRPVASP
jgi:putative phosphoribosyl transferase